jgi:glycosyltransferase involved in cell wall biosynthesis
MGSQISISLVIPVRDEGATLPELLESIAAQSLHPNEVVFVDAGSVDETVRLLQRAAQLEPRFRLIEAGAASPGKARNIGIAAAVHEWIALTDAGMRLEPTWLERLVKAAQAGDSADVVFGNYEPLTESFFERCAALAYVAPKQVRNGQMMRGPVVPSSLLKSTVWKTVGGFPDTRAAEDLMFIEALERKGYRIAWAPTATTWWRLRPTLKATFVRFMVYSRYNVWAGRQWDWHNSVRRFYLLLLPFLALAIAHSFWWLLVPLLGISGRTVKRIWNAREGRGLLWAMNPAQFASVGAVLITIDAAAWIGWAQALLWQPDRNTNPATLSGRNSD